MDNKAVWIKCRIPGCDWSMTRTELLKILQRAPRKKWEGIVANIMVEHLKEHFKHDKSILVGIAQMGKAGFDKYLWVDWEWLEKL